MRDQWQRQEVRKKRNLRQHKRKNRASFPEEREDFGPGGVEQTKRRQVKEQYELERLMDVWDDEETDGRTEDESTADEEESVQYVEDKRIDRSKVKR
jgi:hypothetical protein